MFSDIQSELSAAGNSSTNASANESSLDPAGETGDVDADGCEAMRDVGKGFSGQIDTSQEGNIRRAWVETEGISYSAHVYLRLFYHGTNRAMTHTITRVWVKALDDRFFMFGCYRPGQLLMQSDSGAHFRGTYEVDGAGMIANVTIHDHGRGFLTRPSLLLDDGRCRCGSHITGFRLVHGGTGLTPTGRILVYGTDGGSGFEAAWSGTVNGSLSLEYITVLSRGIGYRRSEALQWRLICFNEITQLNLECSGGEQLEFDIGLAGNVTGGMDLCLGYLWAAGGDIIPKPKQTVVSFRLRNTYAPTNGSELAIEITKGLGSPEIRPSPLQVPLGPWP
jgi:hypothetical protein